MLFVLFVEAFVGLLSAAVLRGCKVPGCAEMIHDLVVGSGSILVIGPPGVGKTTLISQKMVLLSTRMS